MPPNGGMIRSAGQDLAVLLWIIIALLTGAAVMAVLLPLGRDKAVSYPHEQARRVYLNQLAELERDKADSRISPREATVARAEIARRILSTEEREPRPRTGGQGARRAVALGALAGMPLVSLSLYLGLGAPGLPGQPLGARLATPSVGENFDSLVAKVEQHLAGSPEDGRGWEVLAPVYLRLGRLEEAQRAYGHAIRLLGSNAARQSGLGEAILAAEGGIVTAAARSAFEAANAVEPGAPGPRFYLALAQEQEGKTEAAAAGWRALLAEAPADAPWRVPVEEALARVSQVEGQQPGPAAADLAAAEGMAPAERAAMIEGMVDGLAERLQAEPDDVEGWLRLIRSYAVLGRPNDASAAAKAALEGVGKPGERQLVEALVGELALPRGEAAMP